MKRTMNSLMTNQVVLSIGSFVVYSFYCLVFALAALPSFLLVYNAVGILDGSLFKSLFFLWIVFVALYVFWICAAVLAGLVERGLTLGITPGIYSTDSITFLRWVVNSGLHLWAMYMVLPYLQGSRWIVLFFRLAGARIGNNVHINTRIINDVYLLDIGNDVTVGGDAVVTCHLFDNGRLYLGRISLGDGAMVGANSYLTPGTVMMKNSKVGTHTNLLMNTKIGEGEIYLTVPGLSLRRIAKLMRKSKA